MEWFEVIVYTHSEAVESLSHFLYEKDVQGIEIEDSQDLLAMNSKKGEWDYVDLEKFVPKYPGVILKGYFNDLTIMESLKNYIEEKLAVIKEAGLTIGEGRVVVKEVEQADWENEWKKHYKPFPVGRTMVIKPSWEDLGDQYAERTVLEIDPGGAFGSGTHETTYTCIEALEAYLPKGARVFDIGCGSGILSIAAAKLGASEVIGVDIHDASVMTTNENAVRNDVADRVKALHGDLTDVLQGKAKVVVANIIADVIIGLTPTIGDFLEEDGFFISSGIIHAKAKEVEEALLAQGFVIKKHYVMNEWNTFVAVKA